jgi:hypothetical protein
MEYNTGAIDVETKRYTIPAYAQKGKEYKCADCNQKVILRKGSIRKAHFAHFSPTNKCQYFEHPNESQLHKDAKYKLAEKLKSKFPIEINNYCPECGTDPAGLYELQVEYSENDEVIIEYRDPNNKYVADIAVLNGEKVKYIFEIKHTHATTTNVRPEPWFEFTTENIFTDEKRLSENDPNDDLTKSYLRCSRSHKSRYCANCRIKLEKWPLNIPMIKKKGMEFMWTQDKPCIKCDRIQYNPEYIKGHRQICKICIANYEDELKKEYSEARCMIFED